MLKATDLEQISLNSVFDKQNTLLDEIKESNFKITDKTRQLLKLITNAAKSDHDYSFYFSKNQVYKIWKKVGFSSTKFEITYI